MHNMGVVTLTSASFLGFLANIPSANMESDLAKLSLGALLTVVCLTSLFLGHKEKMALSEGLKMLAEKIEDCQFRHKQK